MSDDLGKKVEQIAQLLGQEKVPDNLKELISLFAASMNKKEGGTVQPPDADGSQAENDLDGAAAENRQDDAQAEKDLDDLKEPEPDMLETARKAIDRLDIVSDPRINLLNAIRPFMNSRRQQKIGSCIQILKVASLSRLLNDTEKQER